MHNSQDGVSVVASLGRSLTKGDCVGCHSGDNGVDPGNIPYVTHSSVEYGPDYDAGGGLVNAAGTNSLAGGSFSTMVGNDSYGHNVVGISGADATLATTPPGWIASTFPANDGGGTDPVGDINGGAATWSTQLTCAGTNGCHGSHTNADDFADIRGSHHGDDSVIDGTTVAKSYRFLRGILGLEDNDWEFTVSETDHNQYYGVDRSVTSTPVADSQTISYLCAECHGLFHSNDGATAGSGIIVGDPTIDNVNPWLRHPTDFALSSTDAGSEYLSYASAAGVEATSPGITAAYNFIAPLASADVTAVVSNPFAGTDGDIVTCLSCHRAHGSAQPDLLRWDYDAMIASTSSGFDNKGCFACHTTKD
jgi:predicted CXXCH cytochrome family protein